MRTTRRSPPPTVVTTTATTTATATTATTTQAARAHPTRNEHHVRTAPARPGAPAVAGHGRAAVDHPGVRAGGDHRPPRRVPEHPADVGRVRGHGGLDRRH